MLKKTRSLTTKIFSFIVEGKKLDLIKYSKYLQKKVDINLINYKLFKGKYVLYESNTKVKEYNCFNDILIFAGEYLKGKRSGLGIEYYYDGKILFEGRYSNGKRNGKGKEYYHNGTLKFEGEYLNNKRNGKGK